MTAAFVFAVMFSLVILSSFRLLINPEDFKPPPQHIVRIFNYAEIELPRSISMVESGMSAYPIIQDQSLSSEASSPDESLPAATLRNGSPTKKHNLPGERTIGGDISTVPGQVGIDKIQTDDRTTYPNDMGNPNAPANRNDRAGGGGASQESWRKGGYPVPGKSGEPPSGVDRSGIGSSSKPSAGNSPYGMGSGENGNGDGSGAFSLQWLQGMTRRKLSGELPSYPPGATVSAQVRILALVSPDGTVRSVQPQQKANRLLEEAAMKAVRSWKFESLGSSLPQVEQSCIITFSFRLK